MHFEHDVESHSRKSACKLVRQNSFTQLGAPLIWGSHSVATAVTKANTVFLSYGRSPERGTRLAARLREYLTARDFDVWQDEERIRAGYPWSEQIRDGIRDSKVLLALLSPHAVRTGKDAECQEGTASVCLEEIQYARDRIPILPVMTDTCEIPFVISRPPYIDARRWDESSTQCQAILDAIVSALVDALHGNVRERQWYVLPAPWDFAAALKMNRAGFHGRSWLLSRIDRWLAEEKTTSLLIVGDPGIGKSALAAELVHRNPSGQVLAYHVCDANIPDTLKAARFVQNLAANRDRPGRPARAYRESAGEYRLSGCVPYDSDAHSGPAREDACAARPRRRSAQGRHESRRSNMGTDSGIGARVSEARGDLVPKRHGKRSAGVWRRHFGLGDAGQYAGLRRQQGCSICVESATQHSRGECSMKRKPPSERPAPWRSRVPLTRAHGLAWEYWRE